MNQIVRIMKENGGSPWRAMVLPLVQMPVFISAFFALRKSGDFIPAMKTGGLWWFSDLTAPGKWTIEIHPSIILMQWQCILMATIAVCCF